jgi:hypothetical protein
MNEPIHKVTVTSKGSAFLSLTVGFWRLVLMSAPVLVLLGALYGIFTFSEFVIALLIYIPTLFLVRNRTTVFDPVLQVIAIRDQWPLIADREKLIPFDQVEAILTLRKTTTSRPRRYGIGPFEVRLLLLRNRTIHIALFNDYDDERNADSKASDIQQVLDKPIMRTSELIEILKFFK